MKSKKFLSTISILLVFSLLLSLSVFAADGEEWEDANYGETTSGNLFIFPELTPTYETPSLIPDIYTPSSFNDGEEDSQGEGDGTQSVGVNSIVDTIQKLWDNLSSYVSHLPNLLNIANYLRYDGTSYASLGNMFHAFSDNFTGFKTDFGYMYNGAVKGLYNMWSSNGGSYGSGGQYWQWFKYNIVPDLENISTKSSDIYTKTNGIATNVLSILNRLPDSLALTLNRILSYDMSLDALLSGQSQGPLLGLYQMFSSVNANGVHGHYYDLFDDVKNAVQNTASGVANTNTSLLEYFTKDGKSLFKSDKGRNYISEMDANLVDVLNYLFIWNKEYIPLISDIEEGVSNGFTGLSNSLGYTGDTSLAAALGDISDSQDTQVQTLKNQYEREGDILDAINRLANRHTNDTNYTVVNQYFLDGSSDTSIGVNDLLGLKDILSKFRSFLSPGVSLSDFGSSFDDAVKAGSSFFSQEVYNDLYGVG